MRETTRPPPTPSTGGELYYVNLIELEKSSSTTSPPLEGRWVAFGDGWGWFTKDDGRAKKDHNFFDLRADLKRCAKSVNCAIAV